MSFDLDAWLHDSDRKARQRARVAEHVERCAAEGAAAAAACARGDCVHACLDCRPRDLRQERRQAHAHGCAGYVTVKCIEHGEPLVRSRICERRLKWARDEAEKARAQRARTAREKKGEPPPRSWGAE